MNLAESFETKISGFWEAEVQEGSNKREIFRGSTHCPTQNMYMNRYREILMWEKS